MLRDRVVLDISGLVSDTGEHSFVICASTVEVEPLAIGVRLCDKMGKESLHGLHLIHCGNIYKYVLDFCVQSCDSEVGHLTE